MGTMSIDIRQNAFAVLRPLVSVALLAIFCTSVLAQDFDKDKLDIDLVNQNGDRVNLYSDLIEGKTVVVAICFTKNTTICPPLMANLSRLEQQLAKENIDCSMVFVSNDPATDTPERLKAYAAKFGFKGTLVTGETPVIEKLLRHLLVITPDKNDVAPDILIGNERAEPWARVYGLSGIEVLMGKIRDVSGNRDYR